MNKLLMALVCTLLPVLAGAQNYPEKPITLVVGFPPGGSNDVVARTIAPRMAQILGQPVVVENRPGANATIATQYVAKSAPDGYTITLGSVSPLVISLATYPNIPYDTAKDLTPINTVALALPVLAINPSVPAKTLRELVALARTKQVTISSSGNGGLSHLLIETLRSATSANFLHVPYKGAGPAVTDTIGGHVNGVIMDLPALASQVKEGKLRAIAVTNRQRTSVLPDVPTTGEEGLPAVYGVNWFGLMAPKGTPASIVAKINDALVKAVATPQVIEAFASVGVEPFTQATPEAFHKFLEEEIVRWGKTARDAGVKSD